MAAPVNFLQQVQTYQESGLAYLQNLFGILANTNSKFKDFEKMEANLGSTVTFDKPPRFTTVNSLVAQFESAVQRVESLSVDQQISSSFAFTAQQMIFNIDPMNYMEKFGMAAIKEIGSAVEQNLAESFITQPYRFYGNGYTPINTFGQLADAEAFFREYGAAPTTAKAFLSNLSIPAIVNSGLNQFVPRRNDEMAMSWDLGKFSDCEWFRSNLLQVHIAGSEGNAGANHVLTVVSTTKNADGDIIAITFSGTDSASDDDSIKKYDRLQMQDNVSGFPNLRLNTFIGFSVSGCPVQFQANADAASTAGSQVTVTLRVPLRVGTSKTDAVAINTDIVAGMQAKVLPSHRAGVMYSGDCHYLAMPALPDNTPYDTGYKPDPDTGISIRQTFGTVFGQNQQGMIYDAIWGNKLVPDYSMCLVQPL